MKESSNKKNINLNDARKNKNDEFYTLYEDIEKELKFYNKEQFKDKIIYCNCDGEDSNFVKYFKNNKDYYQYKELIYTGIGNGGGFQDNIELLKKADIIITNPPFSIIKDYLLLLLEHKKKFLFIGAFIKLSSFNFFTNIKNGNIKIGINRVNNFMTPSGNLKKVGCLWYTNLEFNKNYSSDKKYFNIKDNNNVKYYDGGNEDKYERYYNLPNAINVNKLKDIPSDYYGLMGVPITFLNKYDINTNEFKIISSSLRNTNKSKRYKKDNNYKDNIKSIVGDKEIKKFSYNDLFKITPDDNCLINYFSRIIIKRIKK